MGHGHLMYFVIFQQTPMMNGFSRIRIGMCVKNCCNNWFKELKIAQHSDAINFDQKKSAITTVLVDLKIQSQEDNQLIITDEKSISQIKALLTKQKKITIMDEKKPAPRASVVDPPPNLKKTNTKVLSDGKSITSDDEVPLSNLLKKKSYTTDTIEITNYEKKQKLRKAIGRSMGSNEDELPLSELKKAKSHTTDNPETIVKEKKQKLRKQIGQSMDTDNEDSRVC